MKKTFTLLSLLMVLTASDLLAQNYQPINSHSLQVFYQENSFPLNSFSGGNMWGTKIDSVAVTTQGDSLYYNYRIYRDTSASGSGCIWWNAPNWNGIQTKVDTLGSSWFYNQSQDSIRIYHQGQLNEEWLAYTFDNGDSLLAKIISVEWIDDGWVEDSVKTIRFSRVSNGIEVSDPLNNANLQVYQNHGFRKTMDFLKFPFETDSIMRVDLNSINANSPGYKSDNVVVPFPSVGDGYLQTTNWHTGSCYVNTDVSILVNDVQPDGNNGDLLVSIIKNQEQTGLGHITPGWDIISCDPSVTFNSSHNYNQSLILHYQKLPDTIKPLIQDSDGLHCMPRENGAAYLYSVESNCGNPTIRTGGDLIDPAYYYYDSISDPCLNFYPPECESTPEMIFSPYLGYIGSFSYSVDSYCTAALFTHTDYSYLKVGDFVCGEYAMVGIEENQRPKFSIYPNPTNGVFQMQLSDWTAAKNLSVTVYDMLGRTVESLKPQTSTIEIDASAWPNGVYSISLVNQSGARHTERLVMQH
ncbi:MAG: T9SS type A sorting domain-containing protein [Flavobacteriales bacterium]|nr:T9SS type A sorting domain-containing protein [Flavobacteriales bacterium]